MVRRLLDLKILHVSCQTYQRLSGCKVHAMHMFTQSSAAVQEAVIGEPMEIHLHQTDSHLLTLFIMNTPVLRKYIPILFMCYTVCLLRRKTLITSRTFRMSEKITSLELIILHSVNSASKIICN